MTFKFLKTGFNGDQNVGLYGFATNDYCLLGIEPKKLKKIEATLGTKIKITSVAGTELMGIFAAGNKNGIILTKIIEDYELKNLKKLFDINIEVIKSKHTTNGNLILCNDNGCLISKHLKTYKKKIQDVLGVEVDIGTVADLEVVGSAAVATNIGCLCHRAATEEEINKIESLLKVRADIGTVNYGSPFIKAGLIVNSKGMIVSETSTGPELGRVDEVFNPER